MPKPVTLPRWATDLTNNDAPSAGQMNTGWTPGQTGVSDYDNYIKYWTYKWIEWFDFMNGGTQVLSCLFDGFSQGGLSKYTTPQGTIGATASAHDWVVGVSLDLGRKVSSIKTKLTDAVDAPTTVRFISSDGTGQTVLETHTSLGNATTQTITIAVSPVITIETGKSYYITFTSVPHGDARLIDYLEITHSVE